MTGADYKGAGGKLVRVRLSKEHDRIKSLHISGDFFLVPEESLSRLEERLIGVQLEETEIRKVITSFFARDQVQTLGVSPEDLVRVLLLAGEKEATA